MGQLPTAQDIDAALSEAAPAPKASGDMDAIMAKRVALPPVTMGERGFEVTTLEGAFRLAKVYIEGGAVPAPSIKDCEGNSQKVMARVLCIIEAGKSLGIGPRESLSNIAYIRGRLCIWGDLAVALCQRHRDWAGIECVWTGSGMERACTVTVHRKGCPDAVQRFGADDAKRAGLAGDVWAKYPDRMLQNRARAFALRDQFADALMGIGMVEEYDDGTKEDTAATAAAALAG
jgi:hypothetical protein